MAAGGAVRGNVAAVEGGSDLAGEAEEIGRASPVRPGRVSAVTAGGASEALDEAVRSLRAVILAGENYRQVVAQTTGLGVTETQAISYLAIHGDRGQNDLGADLGITSGASTALVDRLERQGVAERFAHPHDRRRVLVRLTDAGRLMAAESHDWLAASFTSFPPEDLPALAAALHQIAADLRTVSESVTSQK